jgi:hypothetical protein
MEIMDGLEEVRFITREGDGQIVLGSGRDLIVPNIVRSSLLDLSLCTDIVLKTL